MIGSNIAKKGQIFISTLLNSVYERLRNNEKYSHRNTLSKTQNITRKFTSSVLNMIKSIELLVVKKRSIYHKDDLVDSDIGL
jgi:hypothetical protein